MSSRKQISNTFTVTTMDDPVSVQAQYAPNANPTSGQIHTTWQSGDLYMRTRESDSSVWSSWHKIVGESGDETDFSFGISQYKTTTNAQTAPSDITTWSDAPLAVTSSKPYLWAKVQKKSWNESTQSYDTDSTSYIRLTGEDGQSITGPRGKMGRIYYYAQEWSNSSSVSYQVTDAEAPYFLYNNQYWVFNPESNGTYTMAQMGTPSSSSSNWKLMVTDFKYLITEAIFGSFAHFGSAIISGDWLISIHGTINGTAYGGTALSPDKYDGKAAYLYFNSSYPHTDVDGNFIPNYAVDLLTGKSYQNDAYIKGQVVATDGSFTNGAFENGVFTNATIQTGTIGGFTIDSNRIYNVNWNAGVDISYDNKIVRIGKNAQGAVNTEQAIIRAENTKSGQTYNTALYLNAQGATYNYAFYGNGNGVLNGLMFGYKIQYITMTSGSTDVTMSNIQLRSGSTIVITGSHTSGWVTIPMFSLGEVRQCLGISATNTSTAFAIEVSIINQSNYDNVRMSFLNNDVSNYSSDSLPKRMSFDNTVFTGADSYFQLAKGDYIKVLLMYRNTTDGYRAFIVVHNF